MQKKPIISIITTTYNIEKYLSGCLNCILGQTFEDFELILVDDGSTDSTGRICDEYARIDSRIRVIHQENKGVSDSWNHAMEYVRGQYVAFVDGDDLIHPRMYEYLYRAIIETQSDIAYCDYRRIFDDRLITDFDLKANYNARISPKEEELKGIYNAHSWAFIWKGLYSYDCIKDIRFLSGKSCQDRLWSSRAVLNAERIVRVDTVLYTYRVWGNSVSHKSFRKNYTDGVYVGVKLLEYLKENAPEWVPMFTLSIFSEFVNVMLKMQRINYAGDPEEVQAGIDSVMKCMSELSIYDIVNDPYTEPSRKLIGAAGKVSYPFAYATKKMLLDVNNMLHPPKGIRQKPFMQSRMEQINIGRQGS